MAKCKQSPQPGNAAELTLVEYGEWMNCAYKQYSVVPTKSARDHTCDTRRARVEFEQQRQPVGLEEYVVVVEPLPQWAYCDEHMRDLSQAILDEHWFGAGMFVKTCVVGKTWEMQCHCIRATCMIKIGTTWSVL